MKPTPSAHGMHLDHERLASALVKLGESIGETGDGIGSVNAEVTKDAPADGIVTVSLTVDYHAPADDELLMNPLQYGTEHDSRNGE